MGKILFWKLSLLLASAVGEKSELDGNQSVFRHGPTQFTQSVNVWNKPFNWPIYADFLKKPLNDEMKRFFLLKKDKRTIDWNILKNI